MDHVVCVIVEAATNKIIEIIKDINLKLEKYDDLLPSFKNMPILEFSNPEIFPWYCDQVLDALSKIGDRELIKDDRLCNFFAYETIGAACYNTAGLAKVDFS